MSKQEREVALPERVVPVERKIYFLAKLAARYKGQTVIEFVENSIRQALSPAAVLGDEPNPGHGAQEAPSWKPLWSESLWHEEEAARLFNVAMLNSNLLTPKQSATFLRVFSAVGKQAKQVTLENFVEAFNAMKEGNE